MRSCRSKTAPAPSVGQKDFLVEWQLQEAEVPGWRW